MGAQLSLKTAMPLAEILATCRKNVSNTGPSTGWPVSPRLIRLSLAVNFRIQGAVSIRKTVLPGMAIPMLKIRRPNGRLIFNMEIAIRR